MEDKELERLVNSILELKEIYKDTFSLDFPEKKPDTLGFDGEVFYYGIRELEHLVNHIKMTKRMDANKNK